MRQSIRQWAAAMGVAATIFTSWAHAQAGVVPNGAEREAAVKAAQAAQIEGPAEIKLRDQAVLKLPAAYVWVPEPAARRLMKSMGNHPDDRELGLVFPKSADQNWVIVAEYEPAGYIKDDDAKKWNVEDLLKSLQDGTQEANKDRKERGFAELEIIGWVEKPTYQASDHRLIWSIAARHKGDTSGQSQNINYNTYALGRDGYITMDLITGQSTIGADKAHVQAVLGALQFTDGKRYEDFNASTDKVAAYGLAALVGGLAVKKLGLLALATGFFLKFAKVIALTVAGGVGIFRKFFKGKSQ
ncbi:MAG: DUF2167 domain-containing protein [Burkholderiales bacterium]|nr:DUF2167 domain-containing protein [Burkholderiales bacterium]